jgi:LmbE family N-acetylglucosaminyl deacetylase
MTVSTPRRALAIGAHPDDIEFGCGATIAKWARAGCSTTLLVLTDGSKGSWDPDEDVAGLVSRRREEQRAASAALGAAAVEFLDQVDGELVASPALRERVVAAIRRIRPDTVLGHDPWKRYRLHPDHREAGWVTVDALIGARDPHFFPDQTEPPHRPARLLLFEPDVVDHLEALDDADVDAKLRALECHRSQWHSTMGIEDGPAAAAQRVEFERGIVADLHAHGEPIGRPAEPYKLLTDL